MSLPRSFMALAALCGAGAVATAQISFQPSVAEPLQGLRPDWIASGDFDNDGDRDLAVSTGQLSGAGGPDWVEILVNNGQGNFGPGQQIVIGNNVSTAALVAANFDGDADIDLAVSLHDTGVVQMLINNGGTFSLGSSVQTGGSEPRHMAGGDVDNDGDIDLVTSNRASNNLRVVLNNGAGVLSLGALIGTGVEPRHVVIAKLNADNLNDLAVSVHDSRRIEVLPGAGGGSFGAAQFLPMPSSDKPSGLAAADLDGDGDLDLAAPYDDNDFGFLAVFRNAGNASFTSASFATNGANPDMVVAADLDLDGDLDLAIADEDANLVSLMRNLGAAQFATGVTMAVGLHPSAIVAAEFDGNGSPDLATANRDSNNVSVLINNASGTGGPVTYCTAGTSVNGCVSSISANANPSVNHSTPCVVTFSNADAQRAAIFFYGLQSFTQPWCAGGNSTLCVKSPTQRGPLQATNGTFGTCNGSVSLDWNAFQVGNPGLLGAPWTAGEKAFVQGWYRDPGACKNTQLSNAVELTYQP